ncbi:MAG: hypothetical protein Q8N04_11200 [Nitrospira sp.]|nr:hypothetical protein [Nitrospira sp.]
MAAKRMVTLAGVMTVGSLLVGCGLDGVRGTILAVEGNRYVIRELSGNERRSSIDEQSHRDGAKPGDEVRVFIAKDGYAAYIQKLEP